MNTGLVLGIAVPIVLFALFEARRVLRDRAADRQARREALASIDCDVWARAVHGDRSYARGDHAAPGISDDLSRRSADREQGA